MHGQLMGEAVTVLEGLDIPVCQQMDQSPYLTPHAKVNSKWAKDWEVYLDNTYKQGKRLDRDTKARELGLGRWLGGRKRLPPSPRT